MPMPIPFRSIYPSSSITLFVFGGGEDVDGAAKAGTQGGPAGPKRWPGNYWCAREAQLFRALLYDPTMKIVSRF